MWNGFWYYILRFPCLGYFLNEHWSNRKMSRNDLLKWLALGILAMLSAYVVTPPKEKIRLGLDIKGGTSFTVVIDEEKLFSIIQLENPDMKEHDVREEVAKALNGTDSRTIEVIRNRIDKTGINEPVIQAGKEHRINIQLPGISPEKRAEAEASIKSAAFLEFKLVHAKNNELVDKLFMTGRAPEGYVQGDGRSSFKRGPDYNDLAKDPDYFTRLSLFEVPDPRYAFMLERNKTGGEITYRPVFVLRKAEMNGSALSRAEVDRDPMTGEISVSLSFNSQGSADFARLTKRYKPRGTSNKDSDSGRQLAIILDDTLYSAPSINSEIPNGRATITGSFSVSDASQLRNILNAGSLPAPMKILEQRAISPTLGLDAVTSGVKAGVAGIALVMVFMLIYYAYCGMIANIALLFNMLLLPAGLVFASNVLGVFVPDSSGGVKDPMALPVLTMPGIAGIILTLAMAIDANVLIFERMREEFKTGKSARAAVAAGYERAFLAIFDSNTTTLLVAAILYIFGVGPLRGYAVTLAAGILISMFTALVVTRLIFNATVPETRVKPFKMFEIFKSPNYDFLKYGKLCITVSLGIIILTTAVFLVRASINPAKVMTVDFVGGSAITFSYKERADESAVRRAIETVVGNPTIQYQSTPDKSSEVLQIMTSEISINGEDSATLIKDALIKGLPQCGFQLENEDKVGAIVGNDLKRAAFLATLISLIGMLIYISLRFEYGFALGAIIALAHDALFTLGVYSLCGRQMSLTTVAALLTVVGYSINDSIVILDRIREDFKKDSKSDIRTICNRAINATLSRTVLTSGTTLFAVMALFLFGGGAINDFALMMLIGVVVGSYSSVFVATPITLFWYKYRGQRPSFMQKKEK